MARAALADTPDGHPDALGLAEIVRFPRELAELPAPGTPITGRVINHGEHNCQVRIQPTEAVVQL